MTARPEEKLTRLQIGEYRAKAMTSSARKLSIDTNDLLLLCDAALASVAAQDTMPCGLCGADILARSPLDTEEK